MSYMRLKYRKVAETKKPHIKGGGSVFCFDFPEKATTVVFGHPANHPWKRMVSRGQSCLSSPLPTAIVFTNKKEGFCAKNKLTCIKCLGI